jgi:hypothetical protein
VVFAKSILTTGSSDRLCLRCGLVCCPKPSVQVLDLLKTTKLHGVFDIQEDETAAIQSFSRGAGATS